MVDWAIAVVVQGVEEAEGLSGRDGMYLDELLVGLRWRVCPRNTFNHRAELTLFSLGLTDYIAFLLGQPTFASLSTSENWRFYVEQILCYVIEL